MYTVPGLESWNSVYLDGEVPQEVLADVVQASYRAVFSSLSKKARREMQDEQYSAQ